MAGCRREAGGTTACIHDGFRLQVPVRLPGLAEAAARTATAARQEHAERRDPSGSRFHVSHTGWGDRVPWRGVAGDGRRDRRHRPDRST
jgi:hypothetical protein